MNRFQMTDDQAETIISDVRKNRIEIYDEAVKLLNDLNLEGFWIGRNKNLARIIISLINLVN